MKLELKENMYIRTKDGHIDKILLVEYAEEKRQQYPNHPSKKYWRDKILLLKAGYWRTTQNIIKASYNIIDILQVGDFVNGNEVMEADWINENGEYEEGLAFPMYASDDLDVIENWLPLRCVDIKSIVTKEQMESMSYEVK